MTTINQYEGDRPNVQHMIFKDVVPVVIEQCNYYSRVGNQIIFWHWSLNELPIVGLPSTVAIFRIKYKTIV